MSDRRYRVVLLVLVVAAAIAVVVVVRSSDNHGGGAVALPESIERVVPTAGDEVIRQAELGIDLAPGYDGTIILNGIEIPVDEQRRVPEQNQVFFTPREGAAVERLDAGPNCALALVWKASDGRGTVDDQTYPWCFEAL
jgi:hypothetical protein